MPFAQQETARKVSGGAVLSVAARKPRNCRATDAKAARELEITVPPTIRARADEIIE
jgi:hypothetical protein